MERLATIDWELAAMLGDATPERQVEAAWAAATWAARLAFRSGAAPSSLPAERPIDRMVRARLRSDWGARCESLDDAYFDIVESDQGSTGVPVEFYQARAASAVACALEDDPLRAVMNAVYEAFHATQDLAGLRDVLGL